MDLKSSRFIINNPTPFSVSMNEKLFLSLAFITAASLAVLMISQPKSSAFEDWKIKFKPTGWTSSEEQYRRLIFQRNLEVFRKHNEDPEQTYKKGVNQFTVLTQEQFVLGFLNPIPVKAQDVDTSMQVGAEIDWVAKGMVSPIKDQGQCASCWAFSAIAVVQSYYRERKQNLTFSEQQLVDCSGSYGNHGCNMGSPVSAMKYIKDLGIALSSEYPYVAKTENCKKQGGAHKIVGIASATGCTDIQNALMSRPLGAAIDATQWNNYSSGIFSKCGTSINHAVELVGVTATYWKIKNSWSANWGEHGYIRLAPGNTCGLCSCSAYWGV